MNRIFLVALLFLGACTTSVQPPEQPLFHALEQADYEAALMAATTAEEKGADVGVVALGRGLARFGQLLDRVSLLVSLVLQSVDSADTVADFRNDGYTTAGAATEEEDIQRIITLLLVDFRTIAEDGYKQFSLAAAKGVDYQIDNLTMPLMVYPWLNLSGRWTGNDARFMAWLMGNLTATLMLGQGVDLRFDIYKLAWAVIGPSAGNKDPTDPRTKPGTHLGSSAPGILSALASILNDPKYPDFLGKSKADADGDGRPDGDVLPARSADIAASSWQDLSDFFNEGGGNIFSIEKDGDNGVLILENRIRLNAGGNLDFSGKGEPGTYRMNYTPSFLTAIGHVVAALRASDFQTRITLKGDVLPLLLPPVIGLLDLLDLGSTADAVLALFPRDDIDTLIGLIGSLAVPYGIGIAPGAFLRNFSGLRSIVPPARTDLPRGDMNFIMEWECPGLIGSGVTGSTGRFPQGHMGCQAYNKDLTLPEAAYALKSVPHFVAVTDVEGTLVGAIDDDAIASPWPYFPWPDGSLGHLLVFRSDSFLGDGNTGWQLGDSYLLNGWIAALADKINSLPSF